LVPSSFFFAIDELLDSSERALGQVDERAT